MVTYEQFWTYIKDVIGVGVAFQSIEDGLETQTAILHQLSDTHILFELVEPDVGTQKHYWKEWKDKPITNRGLLRWQDGVYEREVNYGVVADYFKSKGSVENKADLQDGHMCTCSSLDLFNYGCKCGGK